jgi:hypothetical protein
MSGRFQIDWCPLSEVGRLQSFIDSAWKAGHVLARDRELLLWQHPLRGDSDRVSVLQAKEGDHLVAMLGVIPFGFCMFGREVPAGWLTTWVEVPPRRGLGLRLLRGVMDGSFGMLGTIGGNRMTQAILGRLGFATSDSMPRWTRPVHLPSLRTLLRDRPEPLPRESWQRLELGAEASVPIPQGDGFRAIDWSEQAAESWDRSWREFFATHLVGTCRESAFLRRRYIDHPRFSYRVRFIEEGASNAISGLVVTRVERLRGREERVLHVLEFLGADAAYPMMVREILTQAQVDEAAFVDLCCTSLRQAAALEAAGFVRDDQAAHPLPRLFQPLDFRPEGLSGAYWIDPEVSERGADLFSDEALLFSRSDCDQDRPT